VTPPSFSRVGLQLSSYKRDSLTVFFWTPPGFSRWYFNFIATAGSTDSLKHHQALAGGTSISLLPLVPLILLNTIRL